MKIILNNSSIYIGENAFNIPKEANLNVLFPDGLKRPSNAKLPPVLATEQAMEYWQIAMNAKLVNTDYLPLISKTKAALLANEIGILLNLEPRWSPFEELWSFKNLRNNYQRALESPFANDYMDMLHNLFR